MTLRGHRSYPLSRPRGELLKGTPNEGVCRPGNVDSVQLFLFAGFVWWFHLHLCHRNTSFFKIVAHEGSRDSLLVRAPDSCSKGCE